MESLPYEHEYYFHGIPKLYRAIPVEASERVVPLLRNVSTHWKLTRRESPYYFPQSKSDLKLFASHCDSLTNLQVHIPIELNDIRPYWALILNNRETLICLMVRDFDLIAPMKIPNLKSLTIQLILPHEYDDVKKWLKKLDLALPAIEEIRILHICVPEREENDPDLHAEQHERIHIQFRNLNPSVSLEKLEFCERTA